MNKKTSTFTILLIVSLLLAPFLIQEVKADSTFGKTDIGGQNYTAGFDRIYLLKATLTEDGDVTKISVYGRAESGTTDMRCCIYDNDGEPNNLEGVSEEVMVTTAVQWWDFTFDPAVSLTAAIYWIGFMHETGDFQYYFDSVSAASRYQTGYSYPTFPNPIGSMNSLAKELSIYATYTPSGGPTEKTFYGEIPLTFSLNHIKNVGFSRQGTIPLAFTFNTRKTVSFIREATIPLAFSSSSSLTNLFTVAGSIPLNFAFTNQKAVNFIREAVIPLAFTFAGSFSYSLSNFIQLSGLIPLNFAVTTEKTVNFIRQGTIPLVFALAGQFDYTVDNWLSLFGSIPLTFSTTTEKTITLIRHGTIPLQFTIESFANIFQPGILNIYGLIPLHFSLSAYKQIVAPTGIGDVIALASIAFIIAIVALILVTTKKD